ncbi:MAG: hypothetical protein RLZZ461_534 [Planctomycetota bacterium]|jgi:hypothetical protein
MPAIAPSSDHHPIESPAAASADTGAPRLSNRPWVRFAAVGGFLFFLVKGLVWLGVVGAAIFQIAN